MFPPRSILSRKKNYSEGTFYVAKKNAKARSAATEPVSATAFGAKQWLALGAIVLMLSAAATIFWRSRTDNTPSANRPAVTSTAAIAAPTQPPTVPNVGATPYQMTVAQAVMVTEELDFGQPVPTIAAALQQIERGYAADDGQGRTFAILDAYGEPTADGKKLHISMHVSSEKSGVAFLRNKRDGKLIWQARIGKPGDAPAAGKNLMIYVSNGQGGNHVLDGTRGGASVLEVYLKDSQQRLRDVWPDGAEREFTFIYSACGCPVKVMVQRQGDRTRRTTDLPVIFPDDPDAVRTIAGIMKW
jgi:hypothetical protein